ncbi:hypothetical protein ACWD3J_13940 [Streptomyces sp. NPDC002755]
MEIVSIDKDGTVTVRMAAAEARDVRNDIGQQPARQVSKSGDQLHSLLEWATAGKPA